MVHPNEELLRAAYGLRDRAEVDPVGQWIHDDVVWHAEGGDLQGPEQVLAMLAESDNVAGGTIAREIHALFADDEYGMVLTTVRATRGDLKYEDRQVHVYRFQDGRVIEYWGFLGDPQAAMEFWSQ